MSSSYISLQPKIPRHGPSQTFVKTKSAPVSRARTIASASPVRFPMTQFPRYRSFWGGFE